MRSAKSGLNIGPNTSPYNLDSLYELPTAWVSGKESHCLFNYEITQDNFDICDNKFPIYAIPASTDN